MKTADRPRKRSKRLGGKGLGLDAFVRAKSKPRFNPSDIRKRREHYENAKKVKKYRRMIKQIPQEEQVLIHKGAGKHTMMPEKGFDLNDNSIGFNSSSKSESHSLAERPPADMNKKWKKGSNVLERVRLEYMKKKQEEEKLEEEREEALRVKEEAQKKALQKRKDLKVKMFKKTSTGQPLMKHRLEHILERLQQQH